MTDITLQNFEADLVNESMRQPVLLDIWAPWCAPCRTLGPVLEAVERDYGGRFKLAKLNSDDQPEIAGQLSQAFGVRSIPFCVLFHQGNPVDGFVGALPAEKIREFLDKHVPSEEALQAEDQIEEAEALVQDGNADAALDRLEAALAINPASDVARGELVALLLEQGHTERARTTFDPMAGKAIADLRIAALGHWLAAAERAAAGGRSSEELVALIGQNKRDFAARFELAQGHFAAGRFTDALDELLEIVMRDKAWNDEIARKTCVAILELMKKPAPKPAAAQATKGALEVTGPAASAAAGDPVVDSYRRRLSMALF